MLPPTRQLAVVAALAFAASLGFNACDSNDTSMGPDGPPRLTVLFGGGNTLPGAVGDATVFAGDGVTPTDVLVKVDDVCLQGVADGDQDGDQPGGQCLLKEPTEWMALADLSTEWETLVESVEAPLGFHQLRFIITQAVIDAGGTVYGTSGVDIPPNGLEPTNPLQCPSCDQSGIKVIFPGGQPTITEGENFLVAQFDVAESIGRERGNSGRWVMHPVIRGSLLLNAELTVVITGQGTVTSSPGDIVCPGVCAANYPLGEEVTLTGLAAEADGWTFGSWTGDCSASEATTKVVMDANKSCTITFEQPGGGGNP